MKAVVGLFITFVAVAAATDILLNENAYATTQYDAGSYVFYTNVVPNTAKDYAITLHVKPLMYGTDVMVSVLDHNSKGNWDEARFNLSATSIDPPQAVYLAIPGHYWVTRYSGFLTASYQLKYQVDATGSFQIGVWKALPLESSIYLSVNGSYASDAYFSLTESVQGPTYLTLGLKMEELVKSHYLEATISNFVTSKYSHAYLRSPQGSYYTPGHATISSNKAVVTSCWTKWSCSLDSGSSFFVEMLVKPGEIVAASDAFIVNFKAIESDSAFTITLSFALMALLVVASLL